MQNRALLALVALLWLVGCDVDLFGSDWKRLGGGYSLLLAEQDDAVCAHYTSRLRWFSREADRLATATHSLTFW
jgi:hypothetical protein